MLSLSPLVTAILLVVNPSALAAADHNLTIMLITSFGQFGFNSSGAVPAADIALEHINRSPDILAGYNLVYDQVRDSQCHQGRALDAFFNGILSEPVKLAVVGCGCSVATEPVAEISHRWNISQISYASGLAALSDRYRFLRYFRNSPTFEIVSPALRSTINHFQWTRIAVLTQEESLFTGAEGSIRRELESSDITLVSRSFKTGEDPITTVDDLYVESEDYRVFLLNCYSGSAIKIICEAAKRGFTHPRYTWLAYDWYPRGWWRQMSINDDYGDCDEEMLERFLEGVISLRRYPAPDNSSAVTDTGITPLEFEDEYITRATAGGYDVVDAGVRIYDVMWVLAEALNNTMSIVENGDISGTGCSNKSGSLVPLEQFTYTNEKMGCLIQWNLQRTNFSGNSGRIVFDANGTRIHHVVRLRQYQFDENGALSRYTFAYLDQLDNYQFKFEPGFDDGTIYPDGVPLDGTAMMRINTFQTWLVVVFDLLASLGISFAIGCLVFNYVFRKKKVVKLSSPGINYFIVIGAVLMYSSIYFYLLPSRNKDVILARCIFQHWLFTIGYSLAFGAVLAKMWRVYQIFNNPTPNKKILKDYHLVLITMVASVVAVLLLVTETAIPHLRGTVTLKVDQEFPTGISEQFGIREEFGVLVCYEAASSTFFWQIFIFTYLAVLQIVGIILSFQTRKVKVHGLSDSKYIAAIIYISSIVLVVLALVTFALRSFINISNGIFVAGIFILTTIFLALIFIPKMILLYKDPKGNSVFERRQSAITTTCTGEKASILQAKSDLEKQVATLQKALTERDVTIAELKRDNMTENKTLSEEHKLDQEMTIVIEADEAHPTDTTICNIANSSIKCMTC